ncbi:ABC transporter ATP-binding protein [Microbacterium sp. RD1]|uniref:ABC transporter ATP-binding protein n=1 Tax=Microbacterium sp. RD1 TaxID=3457313 RepID=UPI003FA61183
MSSSVLESPQTTEQPSSARSRGEQPLVRIEGLRLAAAGGRREVVHGIDLEVHRGETVGIVGESGSGKTLACRSLLGILPHGITRTAGSLTFDGLDLTTLRERDWRRVRGSRISAVFQDPASYLNPSIRVGRQLDEVFRVRLGHSRAGARRASIAALERLGLVDPARVYAQYPHELSGGMLQRVLLAIALAAEPELLLADEATTALDVTVQAEVLDLLAELRQAGGLTVVLVSHDLAVVSQVCDYVYVLREGVVVEEGATAGILRTPAHPYTRSLRDSHLRYGIERLSGGAA